VTVTKNIIVNNGFQEANINRGGLWLLSGNNYKIYSNNITDNSVFGVQFADNCSNSNVSNNNIVGNDVGIDLLNYALINSSTPFIGTDNSVYGNNLDNDKNALVETAFSYGNISLISGAIGNGTDVVSWDNGTVGNYWSDYNGNGTYVIDQNNVDNFPLAQQIDISVKVPTLTPLPTGISITAPLLLLIVAIVVGIVSLLLYRRHQKPISQTNRTFKDKKHKLKSKRKA
jgi:hypothetical protein